MSIFRQSHLFWGLLGMVSVMVATVIAAGAQRFSGSEATLALSAICSTVPRSDDSEEVKYLVEIDEAMKKMMGGMAAAKPTGDVDRDFVLMMTPHHQGAIDMARSVLHRGRNEKIRRLAQEIIVTQQQEIAAMRMAIAGAQETAPLSPMQATPASLYANY